MLDSSSIYSGLYTTEHIIGTSTSTSIEVKPPQSSTEQIMSETNIYIQNMSVPNMPQIVTEPNVFEYNATVPPLPPGYPNITISSDFFSTTSPAMPQLEGIDYRQSEYTFFLLLLS